MITNTTEINMEKSAHKLELLRRIAELEKKLESGNFVVSQKVAQIPKAAAPEKTNEAPKPAPKQAIPSIAVSALTATPRR